MIPEPVDLLVCDLSFVSVTKVLGPALGLCREDAVILIKPQFEVGREHVGKGGIVSDPAASGAAVEAVVRFVTGQGFAVLNLPALPDCGGRRKQGNGGGVPPKLIHRHLTMQSADPAPAYPGGRSIENKDDIMDYRRLGRSGLKVSEFPFGAWVTFGKQVGEDDAASIMAAAYDNGINFFDNAEGYERGNAELVMGEALSRLNWPRDTYAVSSNSIGVVTDR